jgi:hypothetical protein
MLGRHCKICPTSTITYQLVEPGQPPGIFWRRRLWAWNCRQMVADPKPYPVPLLRDLGVLIAQHSTHKVTAYNGEVTKETTMREHPIVHVRIDTCQRGTSWFIWPTLPSSMLEYLSVSTPPPRRQMNAAVPAAVFDVLGRGHDVRDAWQANQEEKYDGPHAKYLLRQDWKQEGQGKARTH